ncbi:GSCFA domain-containing protein [Formosa haliotis]|uniref:GSCFA domain-containing protein n=1 Tax=Formosa haliotis TaxID=1555194 RepID=UPI00082693CC|nr:GSCFA domain-containing protein [Formosa haliotis]
MKFLTEIPIQQQSENLIDYQSEVLLLGSCFVENIGKKLDYFKFKNLQNPFGVLFQPKAIENLIDKAVHNHTYTEADLFYFNDIWQCYEAHSKLSALSKEAVLTRLNSSLNQTKQFLQTATHVVITLGTAWIYKHEATHTIVANCHKVPQKSFKKELLSVADIRDSLNHILGLIASVNPNVTVLFTVSPIRHTKDGFVENTRSKAHLISAIHQVLETKKGNTFYFPSYEIMMDELRDYRFYTADLVHPNQMAIDYIWEKFQTAWLAPTTSPIMKEIHGVQSGLQHKPFNESSEQHQKFLQNLEQRIHTIQKKLDRNLFNM